MKKFDFKKIGMKTVGLAGGGVAAGMLLKHLPVMSQNEKTEAIIKSGILIAAGAFVPEMMGKKNELVGYAGDGIIATGANNIVRTLMPNLVAGVDQYVAGPGSSINDIDVDDERIPAPSDVDDQEGDQQSYTL